MTELQALAGFRWIGFVVLGLAILAWLISWIKGKIS
jgi:hypothetical protein